MSGDFHEQAGLLAAACHEAFRNAARPAFLTPCLELGALIGGEASARKRDWVGVDFADWSIDEHFFGEILSEAMTREIEAVIDLGRHINPFTAANEMGKRALAFLTAIGEVSPRTAESLVPQLRAPLVAQYKAALYTLESSHQMYDTIDRSDIEAVEQLGNFILTQIGGISKDAHELNLARYYRSYYAEKLHDLLVQEGAYSGPARAHYIEELAQLGQEAASVPYAANDSRLRPLCEHAHILTSPDKTTKPRLKP